MLGELGRFGDQRLDRCGSDFLERMMGRKSTCLRQLAGGAAAMLSVSAVFSQTRVSR